MTYAPDEKAVAELARAVAGGEDPLVAAAALAYMKALAAMQRAAGRFANVHPLIRGKPSNPATIALHRAAIRFAATSAVMSDAVKKSKRPHRVSAFDAFDAGVEAGQRQRRRELRRRRRT